MQASTLPPIAAWLWIQEAYRLFKSQPMAMLFWSVATSFFINILSFIPILGQMILIILTPLITFLTLCACKHITDNVKMRPDMWFAPLKGTQIAGPLLRLGLAYMFSNLFAAFIAVMPFMDNITAVFNASSEPNINDLMQAMSAPLTVFGFFYVLIAALFWHTPALVGWHKIPLKQSLFYSMVACWRNKYPTIVYILIWLGVFYGLHYLLGMIVNIGFSGLFTTWLAMLIDIFITAIIYCSFYAIYSSIFKMRNEGMRSEQELIN